MLAGALLMEPTGAEEGGGACEGAAPVVVPEPVLARGVTSRMPGGAAGGEVGAAFCAVAGAVFCVVAGAVFWAVEEVALRCIDALFSP